MTEPEVIQKLEVLYQELPDVPCTPGCTACCVSPTITLIEFINLMRKSFTHFSEEDLKTIINTPMRQHPKFDGNYYCLIQAPNGFCSIHSGRALACRMHGLPVISQLGISNMENCTVMNPKILPDIAVKTAEEWLNKLMKINRELICDYAEDFYCLLGLNLECWMDILFVDNLSCGELRDIQKIMRSMIPFNKYQLNYTPKTEIFEKIDTISLLKITMEMGDKDSVVQLLEKIKNGYPTTGTYFHDRCVWMLENIPEKKDSSG